MATATTTTVWNNSSDANFRAWGSWLSDRFVTTFSWVQVYSLFGTGTDWTDVTAPGAANTVRVTKIFRMDDASQATSPCFLKVEIGSGSAAAIPGIKITLGTGHDGSGNITGELFNTGTNPISVGASNANSMTHYASGDSGRALISMSASGTSWANTNPMTFCIERRRNGSGTVQTTGFLYAHKIGSTQRNQGFLASSAHPYFTSAWSFPTVFTADAHATFDGKTATWPLIYCMGPQELGINIIACVRASNPVGTQFSCTVLGVSHNYLALQDTSLTGIGGGTLINAAILYE
jgi:hypothetical protein